MTEVLDPCPDCGEPLEFNEVDIGVGIQKGNPRCPACGWSADEIDDPWPDWDNV